MRSNRQRETGWARFQWFFHSEVSGSLVLLACALAALIWANSPWSGAYFHLLHAKIGITWGDSRFALSLHHWVNDLLMVLFFFVVGLEIKREILAGQLSSLRSAILPVSAAAGGMIVPALLYAAWNRTGEGANGWGISMATDIAFALGILALFGRRVPLALKVFLTALAIADDLGAVLVIALFYTETIRWGALGLAVLFLFLLFLVYRFRMRQLGIMIILIFAAWAAVFASGIHATVAGILIALVVPVRSRIAPERFFRVLEEKLADLRTTRLTDQSMLRDRRQLDALVELDEATTDIRPLGISLEHHFHPVQAFVVLPLFALFNAGVPLGEGFFRTLVDPVCLGIIVGLFAGKQVGITLFSWLAIRTGLAEMPGNVTWGQIYGASCVAGIGFTMSLFIAGLAFRDPSLIDEARIGILVASLLSGGWGCLVLWRALPRNGAGP